MPRDPVKKAAYMREYGKRRYRAPESLEANRTAARERYRAKARGRAPEVVAEQHLRVEVEARGGMCPKFIDPARRGAPDRMVLLPGGKVIFVEMKREGTGTVKKHQERYHADLRALGHRVEVLWSKEDVDAFLLTA